MQALGKAVLVALVVSQIGCGTMVHPDRRFQKPTGGVDPGVVAMDAAWMLLFIVPGAVALLVDFATGAIYLPEGKSHFLEPRAGVRAVILEVPRGSQLAVRAPSGVSSDTLWEFELRHPASSLTFASWKWAKGPDISIDIPDSLLPGPYELRVVRDGAVVGNLAVRVRG